MAKYSQDGYKIDGRREATTEGVLGLGGARGGSETGGTLDFQKMANRLGLPAAIVFALALGGYTATVTW